MRSSGSRENGWEVFQSDVLDVLEQYGRYFDFSERVGSLEDNSRPDFISRVSREGKKEVWVVDAKNKSEIDESDRNRMDRYLKMLENNPVDTGLDTSELSSHSFRGIFVTPSGSLNLEGYEQVKFSALHQFLQRELVYTDTEKVVQDIAKMAERKQLSHEQARLLSQSLKPFQERVNDAVGELEKLEDDYVGLELLRPPISRLDAELDVDAVLTHKVRDVVFLFDIPYAVDAAENLENKVKKLKSELSEVDKKICYAALDTFGSLDSSYVYRPESLEEEITKEAGIVSPGGIIELFTPKIPVEKSYGDGFVEVRDNIGLGYRVRVATEDDVHHRVEAVLPEDAASSLNESMKNTGRKIGRLSGKSFIQELEVTSDFRARYPDCEEPFSSYRDAIRSVYLSAVNPVLGRKVSRSF